MQAFVAPVIEMKAEIAKNPPAIPANHGKYLNGFAKLPDKLIN